MPRYLLLCTLPEGWERFDLAEPDDAAAVTGHLDGRLSQQGVGAGERQALTRVAEAALGRACQAGVLVWAIRLPAAERHRPVTLTVGVHSVPDGRPQTPSPGWPALGPDRYLLAPTDPRPLDLLFDDAVGFTRHWTLAAGGADSAPDSLFCAQAVVVARSGEVAAAVTVTALDPADEPEARAVAATVARSLRLAAAPQEPATG